MHDGAPDGVTGFCMFGFVNGGGGVDHVAVCMLSVWWSDNAMAARGSIVRAMGKRSGNPPDGSGEAAA